MKIKKQLHGFSMTKIFRVVIQAGIAGWVLVLAAGCDESFNPKGSYHDQLVLYSVLTTRSDSQFVRVFTTYDPAGHNPLENSVDTYVRNATVTLARDSSVTTLASVVIPRGDKSRYTDDIVGYLAHPYKVQPGLAYTLKVFSEKGVVEASMVCPGKGEVYAENSFVLKKPELYTENISSRIRISPSAHGYLVRIFLEFETRLGDVATPHREELPRAVTAGDGSYFRFDYPIITRRNVNPYEVVYFGLSAYKAFLVDVKSRYGDIKVTGATYILTQVDRNLYTYYNLANGFQDEFSIRTDLPDYTNISGGLGVFGAMVDDSVHVDLRVFE